MGVQPVCCVGRRGDLGFDGRTGEVAGKTCIEARESLASEGPIASLP